MKVKYVLFLLFCVPVYATNYPPQNPQPVSSSDSNSTSNANSKAISNSNASSASESSSNSSSRATGGNAVAVGSGGNANVNSTNRIGDLDNSTDVRVRSITGPSNSTSASSNTLGDVGSNSAAVSSADGAGANSNNVTMVENYQAYRIPVTTAIAASLTSGQDTCLGSASGGVQTQVVGLSLGKTVLDKNCVHIKQVQLLTQMNLPAAACFRARSGKEGAEIDKAMTAAGVDCNKLAPPVQPVIVSAPEVDMSKYMTREEILERENRMLRRQIK